MTEITLIYTLKGVPLQEGFEEFIIGGIIHKRIIRLNFRGLKGEKISLENIPQHYHRLSEMANIYRYIFTLDEAFF